MKQFLNSNFTLTFMLAASLLFSGCAKDKNGERLLFSVEDDIALGAKVAEQTDSVYRAKGQLLEPTSADAKTKKAYEHMRRIVGNILQSNQISYKDEFDYLNKIKIIKDDQTLNAFASPGGHIYVFSGIIKYLETEDQLAGVLGHEIAHADRRHTSKALEKQYGISVLLSIILGENQSVLAEIGAGLATLKFGRDAETEADFYSVEYLGTSQAYRCDGAAKFFEKMLANQQGSSTPEFLSTHPDPENRVKTINDKAQADGCIKGDAPLTPFQELQASL